MSDAERLFREMTNNDIPTVLEIINSHDEDDAEEAEISFARNGIDYFRILEVDGSPVGVTGARPIEGADNSGWLSWTYVHDDYCGAGHGRWMLEQMLAEMRGRNVRKLFISVSDYVDPEDGPIYAAALHVYKSLGFCVEIENPDFYAVGENQFLMGMRLQPPNPNAAPKDENPPIRFCGLDEIVETEGSFFIDWEVKGRTMFTVADLQIGIDAAKEEQARGLYITFPSNLPEVHQPLLEAGFAAVGQLSDYYEDGVHELHFKHNLD